jgi:hypothetical protein
VEDAEPAVGHGKNRGSDEAEGPIEAQARIAHRPGLRGGKEKSAFSALFDATLRAIAVGDRTDR